MQLTKADPNAMLDVFCVHSQANALGAAATFKLPDGSRIDIGNYEYIVIMVAVSGGTATSTWTVVPRESSSQTGPEFNLDGTNGAPDFSMTFTTAASVSTNTSHQRVIRVSDRRQYLNIMVSTLSAGGTVRPVIYALGAGKRANTNRVINTDLAMVGPLA